MSIERRENSKGVRWVVRYPGEPNETFDSEAAAKRREAERVLARAKGAPVVDRKAGKITMRAYLDELITRRVWESSTEKQWRIAIEWSGFADKPLFAITKIHGETLVAESSKVLAKNTVRNRFALCRQLLKAAVEDGRIGTNPWINVKTPRMRRADTELEIPSTGEVGQLIAAAELVAGSWPNLAMQIRLGAFAGLRVGEVSAFRAQCIKADEQCITVNLQQHEGQLRPPKHDSNRDVYVPPALLKRLSDWKHDGPYLFRGWNRTINGKVTPWPTSPKTIQTHWMKLCTELGFDYPFRSLRHFYATSQLTAGVDICTVSKALGHASIDITQQTYVHWLPDNRERSKAAIDRTMSLSEELAQSAGEIGAQRP